MHIFTGIDVFLITIISILTVLLFLIYHRQSCRLKQINKRINSFIKNEFKLKDEDYDYLKKMSKGDGRFNILCGQLLQISAGIRKYLKTLDKTNRELSEKNSLLEEFAHISAHDMKTPLRTINNFVDKLVAKLDSLNLEDSQILMYKKYINKGILQMTETINDSLNYVKINRDIKFERTINLGMCIENAIHRLDDIIDNANTVIKRFKEDVYITGDKQSLMNLFGNLIINGLKFNESENKQIDITYDSDDAYVRVYVKDNGIGIPKEFHKRIFVMFECLNPDKYDGSGTGLAIAEKIMQKHGGVISVESEVGKGSTFILTFPKPIDE